MNSASMDENERTAVAAGAPDAPAGAGVPAAAAPGGRRWGGPSAAPSGPAGPGEHERSSHDRFSHDRFSYVQPAEVAGRPAGEIGYLVALLITAGADLAVFDQVISLVLRLDEWVVWLTVAGFTVCSLTLAHLIGRLLRDRAAGDGPAGRGMLWALVVPWGLLGLVAFIVRVLVAGNDATAGSGTDVGGTSPQTIQLSGAIMFLALYLASGAVAGFGEYLTRNPYRARYRTALRSYRRALRRLRRSQPPYERELSVLQLHSRGRLREELNHQAAVALRLAFADELKRHAAYLIAAHLQDPSATDGMTLPDRRPLAGGPDAGEPKPTDPTRGDS